MFSLTAYKFPYSPGIYSLAGWLRGLMNGNKVSEKYKVVHGKHFIMWAQEGEFHFWRETMNKSFLVFDMFLSACMTQGQILPGRKEYENTSKP